MAERSVTVYGGYSAADIGTREELDKALLWFATGEEGAGGAGTPFSEISATNLELRVLRRDMGSLRADYPSAPRLIDATRRVEATVEYDAGPPLDPDAPLSDKTEYQFEVLEGLTAVHVEELTRLGLLRLVVD